MRLVKSSNYTYEIESEYKLGDTIEFIDENNSLKGQEGIIIGLVALGDTTNYLIEYHIIVRGGVGNIVLCKSPERERSIFHSSQIKLKNYK